MRESDLHPIIRAAAEGRLPDWARVSPSRRAHLERVVDLLADWARGLGLTERDRARWEAAAWLHDALRDVEPGSLSEASEYPPKVRHGPAAARRLRAEGIGDEEVLEAIAAHTLGRPGLGRLGRYLFMADYLEPGREFENDERAALRARLPAEESLVLREVCARRIRWRLRDGKPLHPDTVGFWNELVRATR